MSTAAVSPVSQRSMSLPRVLRATESDVPDVPDVPDTPACRQHADVHQKLLPEASRSRL